MVTLKDAQKMLHEAETLVAKMKGEQAVAQRQYEEARAALHGLGIDPDNIDAAMVTLTEEVAAAQTALHEATGALATAMGVGYA